MPIFGFQDAIVNWGAAVGSGRTVLRDGNALLDVDDGAHQIGGDEDGKPLTDLPNRHGIAQHIAVAVNDLP
jgi:hypothetical protein